MHPVEIGTWTNYTAFANKEQLQIQRDNFTFLPLSNGKSNLCFIYTTYLARLHDAIEALLPAIKIEDTDVVLETEVFHTSRIEGAKTTRVRTSEIHNGSPIKDNDFSEQMVANGFKAVKMLNLYGNKITYTNLINIWNVLVDKCCMNEEIRDSINNPMNHGFRTGYVRVGTWVPVEYDKVFDLMLQWVDFYNSSYLDELPFIKAAILHIALEEIHPFCDGNGRMGRLLMNNYLISRGIEVCKAVSFSMFINNKCSEYNAAFCKAENLYNDCTYFIEFMLECMYDAFHSASEVNKKMNLF